MRFFFVFFGDFERYGDFATINLGVGIYVRRDKPA